MPNMRQQKKTGRLNLTIGARGGLISASDDVINEILVRTNRTARIIRNVKPCLGSVKRVSDDLAIANILADLRHYCDCTGLVFGKLQKDANALYLEEKASEAACPAPSVYLDEVRYRLPQ